MPIITLISDMGGAGYYAAVIKASILSEIPAATIIDITHSIKPFHILEAAFILKNTYQKFPAGTVHLVSVDAPDNKTKRFIAMKAGGHYFIGTDNGLFSLALHTNPEKAVELTPISASGHETFPAAGVFAKAACSIASGASIESIGKEISDYELLNALQPTYDANSITTQIVYTDSYGNCICNLDKTLFQQVAKSRTFLINIKGYEIDSISERYNEKGSGEIVALFSSSGLLELAMTQGNLAEILGLEKGDMVKITFTS
jgi:S-adenosyl-L-methionine hydrolase (adenosine-forming)